MIIGVNGKKIDVKEYGCAVQGLMPGRIPPSVNIFARVTASCQARCPFCSNAGQTQPKHTFDIDKLTAFVEELEKGGVMVNKVNNRRRTFPCFCFDRVHSGSFFIK